MKKISLWITLLSLTAVSPLMTSTARAQDDKQAEFERVWYDTCYTKKDSEKCYAQSKELVEKYPKSSYFNNAQKNIKAYEQARAWEQFQGALNAYYAPPQDAVKLEKLFAASEAYLKFDPAEQHVIAQMALAGTGGALGLFYKDFGKVKGYADMALKAFASTTPPEGWKPEEWTTMRDLVTAQMNQYSGWMLLYQNGEPAQAPKADQEQSLNYLTTATEVRGKDGVGWKDPNNYWLRSIVYSNQYAEMKKAYEAMTEDAKNGDPGKEVRAKINALLDTKLIPDYARVLATATREETKNFAEAAKPQFEAFWKFRTDAPDKADAYIKNYAADPTVASVPVPAKAETADVAIAPTAPAPGSPTVKPAAGGRSTAPGASDSGAKSAAAKPTPKTKKRRRA